MAANGISTLPTKEARKAAKLELARQKRATANTNGYRELNKISNSTSPTQGRPWTR